MSVIKQQASSEAEIREQLRKITEPWEKSRQALGDITAQNHDDGEVIHKHFSVPPLHKYLAKADRAGAPVAQFPRAFVDNILYTDSRDLELMRQLAGEVDYDFRDPNPSHEALERYGRYRAKLIEWVCDDPRRVSEVRSEGGTDMFMHGEPGGGKTTLALSNAMWRMQVNNETFIWAESVDESGTNERTEWLAFAPYATLAIPEGLGTSVRVVPRDTTVGSFTVDVEEIARDVIYYDSIHDLMTQLMPGQFYVVFPDPLHRGCEDVSKFNYINFEQVTPRNEDGPDEPTDADQWWFAFVAHRISGDVYTHPTFINLDEAGNLLDPDAAKDVHQHYQKVKWFRDKYADARKKGVSFGYQAHALSEINKFPRQKIRWRVTMSGNAPPIGRKLPGDRECPMTADLTSSMDAGQAVIWKSPHFAEIKWPNMKGQARLDAEVSIDFERWQDAAGGA
ncbi:hypothetical protein GCM10009037_07200 [Halarchaeum grantii]|uniref:Uncharacterized protein n=1 Tax=Halarchaeum grantii TaxID=1193105 RepID=A0A830EZT3_9EURY|nr:hypothetical protein [Halarchaeum grantii]GGL26129.1 hypothetical protein GCM10009037_07200 [Halarchaeum grantii]